MRANPLPIASRAAFRRVALALFATVGCAAELAEDPAAAEGALSARGRIIGTVGTVGVIARPPRLPTRTAWQRGDRTRLVGTLSRSDRECPEASGVWSLRRGYLEGVRSNGGTRHCYYELRPGAAFTLRGLPDDPLCPPSDEDVCAVRRATQWLDPDMPFALPLAHPDEQAARAAVARSHLAAQRRQIDHVARLPSVRSWLFPRPSAVDVWLLDTARDSLPGEVEPVPGPISSHGEAVGLLVRDIACPEGRGGICPVRFTSKQVLGRRGDQGAVGYIGDIADEIRKAVDGGAEVIVMALGWHRDFAEFGVLETLAFQNATAAVHSALNYAACRNVAVVSAAGNTELGPDAGADDRDPMYPAAFAEARGWTCDASASPRSDRRLIIAASGLGPADAPAPNGRRGGEAEIAAPSFAIVAPGLDGGFVRGGTGSSFAAAQVAGAVTLMRAYNPWLSPAQLRDRLQRSGVPLRRRAGFCDSRFTDCNVVHRLSVCQALRDVVDPMCRGSLSSCDRLPTCAPPAAGVAILPEIDDPAALEALFVPTGVDADDFLTVDSLLCGAVEAVGTQPSYCPAALLENGIRTPDQASSLPGTDPCGACAIDARDRNAPVLYMGLDGDAATGLQSPILDVGGRQFALGNMTLSNAYLSISTVYLPPFLGPAPLQAKLTFATADQTQSVASYIPVYTGP